LGAGAFALMTCVSLVFRAPLISGPGVETVVLPPALCWGGGARQLAGTRESPSGLTFGALACTSFGAFLSFVAYGTDIAPSKPAASAGQVPHIPGVFPLAWAICTSSMTVVALRVAAAVDTVFICLSATCILLMIGGFASLAHVTKVGGYVGLVPGAVAR
jgi:succinate-acetate transporter protein